MYPFQILYLFIFLLIECYLIIPTIALIILRDKPFVKERPVFLRAIISVGGTLVTVVIFKENIAGTVNPDGFASFGPCFWTFLILTCMFFFFFT